jgi:chromosome segregation ATPase
LHYGTQQGFISDGERFLHAAENLIYYQIVPTLFQEHERLEQEGEMKEKEAKQLKRDSARMQKRMNILENHNQQLMVQLDRLRRLLSSPDEVVSPTMSFRNFGTLQSKSVIATELRAETPTVINGL